MTPNNEFNEEPEEYEASGPFDVWFVTESIRKGYLFERNLRRLEYLVESGSFDREDANLVLNKGRKNELRTTLKEILKGGENVEYFISVAMNYVSMGKITEKKVELVIEKGRKNHAYRLLDLVAEGDEGFIEDLDKQVIEGVITVEEADDAKLKCENYSIKRKLPYYLQNVKEGYLQFKEYLSKAVEKGYINKEIVDKAIAQGIIEEIKKTLDYVKNGFNTEYDDRLPILRTAVDSGLLDQEDVHLAINEGKKNAAIHIMEFVIAGIQLNQHIPKLLEEVRKGRIDQEEAFLAIMEGKGLRKLYDNNSGKGAVIN
ncbi:hypothetical protein HZA97_06910 [Candidatus Woesearchaeota archaeon]|nr:hypothetical protein [Candidatus Woesearchaeota archaeon]